MLTGHGCFGAYLASVQKRPDNLCRDCEEGLVDSPKHTVFECAAWQVRRTVFQDEFGHVESLREIVEAIVISEEQWKVFSRYAGEIVRLKVRADMARERAVNSPPASSSEYDEGAEDEMDFEAMPRRRRRPADNNHNNENNNNNRREQRT